ncbi:MAG: response regulator [Anaerolineales bacterium]|nr:response regulator [Anaerolineales bacterium]
MLNKPLAYIIEDDRDAITIFRDTMEMANYTTEVADDGAVAQKRLAEIVPALILLDLHMPNVSGDELLQQIRADDRLAKSRVVVITADGLLGEKLMYQDEFVLLKPVSFLQLRELAEKFYPE